MKLIKSTILVSASFILLSMETFSACNYPSDLDSRGYKCGGRAASVIPGGRLGGNGYYQDSYGRDRKYGRNNDVYDSGGSYFGNNNKLQGNTLSNYPSLSY